MLEFITSLSIWISVLLGIFSCVTDINLLNDSIQFTAIVSQKDKDTYCYTLHDSAIEFLPMSSMAEVIHDAKAYTFPTLDGEYIDLTESSIVSVIGVSNSGGAYAIAENSQVYYVFSTDIEIATDSILGVPISLVVPDNLVPSMFIADTEDCNIKHAYGMYRLLPSYIRNAVEREGWQIVVTNEDLQEKFDRPTPVAGITVPAENRIYLKNSAAVLRYSTYHEVGHVLDYICNNASETPEFIEIFEEENDTFHPVGVFVDNYQKTNTREYWAAAINNILLTANRYEDTAPRTYEYVRRKLATLKR